MAVAASEPVCIPADRNMMLIIGRLPKPSAVAILEPSWTFSCCHSGAVACRMENARHESMLQLKECVWGGGADRSLSAEAARTLQRRH